MWRILFLILILFSANVFAQVQDKPQAIKFDEFGKAKNSVIKKKLNEFKEKVKSEESSVGVILVVGEQNQRKARIKQLLNNMAWRDNCFGQYSIGLIDGGKNKSLTTTFWIVPKGAELPIISQTSPN